MKNKNNNCCDKQKNNAEAGREIRTGILYSLIPHTFCIALVVFSILGAVGLISFIKKALVIPYFFSFLIIFSVVLASISALFYLKKTRDLSFSGIKRKWKYLTILYSTMLAVNLLMFFVIFPATANMGSKNIKNAQSYSEALSLNVEIPCSGHAPLITYELKQDEGVGKITFKNPGIFNVRYNPNLTSPEKIKSLQIFKTFEIINI